jgi:hypothetical protein
MRRFILGLVVGILMVTSQVGCDYSPGFRPEPRRGGEIAAAKERPLNILYIPLDNRPLNYDNVISLAEIAGVQLLAPPPEMPGEGSGPAQTEEIWNWFKDNAGQADACVISLDMLLYGGLAPSRSHDRSRQDILEDMQQLRDLLKGIKDKGTPVYVFATVMRSAASSASASQPGYFARHGDSILRLSQLSDLAEQKLASPGQLVEMQRVKDSIPPEILENYLSRRDTNLAALKEAVRLTAEGLVNYLVVGRDDCTPYSFSRMDMRKLDNAIKQHGVANQTDSYPGADELGAVLLARAVNDLRGHAPRVYTVWATPGGPGITALYEDITLGENVSLHVKSAGGRVVDSPGKADLILAVNTPAGKVVEAATQPVEPHPAGHHHNLANQIARWIGEGKPVAVIDVAYANGSDRALMGVLADRAVLPRLAGYAGCNTAGNSIGMALAHGLLYTTGENGSTGKEEKTAAHREYLVARLVEDWGFQAIVRPGLIARHHGARGAGTVLDNETATVLQNKINSELNSFLQDEINPQFGQKNKVTNVTLPWNRLFDLRFELRAM